MLLRDLYVHDDNDHIVIADWNCPVCGAYTPRVLTPGRPKVYCSNACRQRAYRYRCDHGIRLLKGDGQPVERSAERRITHAMRPTRDPISRERTSARRAVSLCGVFVRPATDLPWLTSDFRFDNGRNCFRCLELTGAGRPEVPMLYAWQMWRSDYDGPPIPAEPAPAGYELAIRGLPRRWHNRPRPSANRETGQPGRASGS